MHRILAVNPGSTSTKIAVYDDLHLLFEKNIHHDSAELTRFASIADQFPFRRELIMDALKQEGIDPRSVCAIVGRGGLVLPLESGVYPVNEAMLHDLKNPPSGEHASNLGGLIAYDIAASIPGSQAFIVDPVVVDEMEPVARLTGMPELPRLSIFHALNQKAVGRRYAESSGKHYEDINVIVSHLGGGISIGAHRKGRVVDVNNTLDGEGPFTPERSGTLPTGDLVKLCYSGKYTKEQLCGKVKGQGGLVAHLGTNDMRLALEMVTEGDDHAALVIDAMCYNVGKSIGQMAAVLHGEVDAVIITGGMAHSKSITGKIAAMVEFIAPVVVYPGEDELEALVSNALRVLSGKEQPKVYTGKRG